MTGKTWSAVCVMALVLGLAGALEAGPVPVAGDYYWQFDKIYTGSGEDSGAKDVRGDRSLKVWDSGTLDSSEVAPLPNPDLGPFSDGTDPAVNLNSVYGNDSSPIRISRGSTHFGMKNKSWTLEGWFKHQGTPISGDWGDIIVGTRNSTSWNWNGGFSLKMHSNGLVQLYVAEKGGSAIMLDSDASLQVLNDQQWHHFAITWDHDEGGPNGWLQLYFDGVLHDEKAGLGNVDGTWGTTGHNSVMAVGFRQLPTADNFWEGWLDEFRMTYDILEPNQFLSYVEPTSTDTPIAEPAGLGLLGLALLGLRKRRS